MQVEAFFDKEIENFPAESSSESAGILNNALEKIIRECPEQYLWMHRRFKTRPLARSLFTNTEYFLGSVGRVSGNI